MKRKRNSGPQKEGKTSHLKGGSRKYAILPSCAGVPGQLLSRFCSDGGLFPGAARHNFKQITTSSWKRYIKHNDFHQFTDINGNNRGNSLMLTSDERIPVRATDQLLVTRDQTIEYSGTIIHSMAPKKEVEISIIPISGFPVYYGDFGD